jgi:hypothetical protein
MSKALKLFKKNKFGKLHKAFLKVYKIFIFGESFIEILNVQISSGIKESTN